MSEPRVPTGMECRKRQRGSRRATFASLAATFSSPSAPMRQPRSSVWTPSTRARTLFTGAAWCAATAISRTPSAGRLVARSTHGRSGTTRAGSSSAGAGGGTGSTTSAGGVVIRGLGAVAFQLLTARVTASDHSGLAGWGSSAFRSQ